MIKVVECLWVQALVPPTRAGNYVSRLLFLQSSRFLFCGDANLEAIIASEKEIWNREKSALQKTLKKTEAEVYKLKAELRNDTLLQNLNTDSENVSLKVGDIFLLMRVLHFCLFSSLCPYPNRLKKCGWRSGCLWRPFSVL